MCSRRTLEASHLRLGLCPPEPQLVSEWCVRVCCLCLRFDLLSHCHPHARAHSQQSPILPPRMTGKVVDLDHIGISNGCILHPGMRFRMLWDALVGILILFTVIEVPFRIGFDQVRKLAPTQLFQQ